MAAIFDQYWNSPRVYPLKALEQSDADPGELQGEFERLTSDAIRAYPSPPGDESDLLGYKALSGEIEHPPLKMIPVTITVIADDPRKAGGRAEAGNDPTTVTAQVIHAISEAKSEVILDSPYLIPGKVGMEVLARERAAGIHIQALTNSLASNDEPFATAAYAQYRVPMLKLGIDLYETDSSQMKNNRLFRSVLHDSIGRSHAKLIVIDRRVTFVGSMNLDFRSSRLNTELGLLVESTELAAEVYQVFDLVGGEGSYHLQLNPKGELEWVGVENGQKVIYASDPGVDLVRRLQILLLFPFVNQDLL
jgi:putative cardiolipin synthase